MVIVARLTVRAQQVDTIELGSHAVAEARNDVEMHIPPHGLHPSEVIGQVDDVVHSSFATSLFKVVESLRVVVEIVDETAKVDIL